MRRCTTLCNSRPESVCMPDTFPATPHLTAAFVFPGRRQSRFTMHLLSAHPLLSLARLRKIVDTRPPTATTGNALTTSVTRGITEPFRLRSKRLAGSPTWFVRKRFQPRGGDRFRLHFGWQSRDELLRFYPCVTSQY